MSLPRNQADTASGLNTEALKWTLGGFDMQAYDSGQADCVNDLRISMKQFQEADLTANLVDRDAIMQPFWLPDSEAGIVLRAVFVYKDRSLGRLLSLLKSVREPTEPAHRVRMDQLRRDIPKELDRAEILVRRLRAIRS